MNRHENETGGVLLTALLVGLMLALLGGTAMNSATTETTASSRHLEDTRLQLLAGTGIEQMFGWLTQGILPGSRTLPTKCAGTAEQPDVRYDSDIPADTPALNAALTEFPGAGRILKTSLYRAGYPDGYCTVEVTAESQAGARRTISLQFGNYGIPLLPAAAQFGSLPDAGLSVIAYGGNVQGPTASPAHPWAVQAFKDLAKRIGTYYVLNPDGLLYQDGIVDPSKGRPPSEVLASQTVGDQRGLLFIDTVENNPGEILLDAQYMEGTFFINANVSVRPKGPGPSVPWNATENPDATVQVADATVRGVLYTTGTLHIDGQARVVGAVVAEQSVSGSGSLEIWYDQALGRGRVRGLPAVYPLPGTWRE